MGPHFMLCYYIKLAYPNPFTFFTIIQNIPLLLNSSELETRVEDLISVKFVASRAELEMVQLTRNGAVGLALTAGTGCCRGSTPEIRPSVFNISQN